MFFCENLFYPVCVDVDPPSSRRQLCGGSKSAVERMLEFGRTLYNMSQRLMQEQGKDETNKKMLQVRILLRGYFIINFISLYLLFYLALSQQKKFL